MADRTKLERELEASLLLGDYRDGWADAMAAEQGKRKRRTLLDTERERWWRRGFEDGRKAFQAAKEARKAELLRPLVAV